MIKHYGMWSGFNINQIAISKLIDNDNIIIGPFLEYKDIKSVLTHKYYGHKIVYISFESYSPYSFLADYKIGYFKNSKKSALFPYWVNILSMYHDNNDYKRYGSYLHVEYLERALIENVKVKKNNKAIFIVTNYTERRKRLIKYILDSGIKVDVLIGGIHISKDDSKYELIKEYKYCVCFENTIKDGYITEKIPEAFYAGCIPITNLPSTLIEKQFNKNACISYKEINKVKHNKIYSEALLCNNAHSLYYDNVKNVLSC